MRRRFSERYGFKKPRDKFQLESIDFELQNRIWNQIKRYCLDEMKLSVVGYIELKNDKEFVLDIYDKFFKAQYNAVDIFGTNNNIDFNKFNKNFEKRFFNIDRKKEWYKIYDLIEVVYEIYYDSNILKKFHTGINNVLKSEGSAYRLINGNIVQIIDEVEITEIEEALNIEYSGAKRHLSNALELLSDRENPDYPNSIKESISAVEAVAKEITGKETDLAKCLKEVDLGLNKQFKTALTNLYGWTNKEDGIRHGHTGEELKTTFEEAKFMLVTCSAFVNYMIAKEKQD